MLHQRRAERGQPATKIGCSRDRHRGDLNVRPGLQRRRVTRPGSDAIVQLVRQIAAVEKVARLDVEARHVVQQIELFSPLRQPTVSRYSRAPAAAVQATHDLDHAPPPCPRDPAGPRLQENSGVPSPLRKSVEARVRDLHGRLVTGRTRSPRRSPPSKRRAVAARRSGW
jgi:hypothetical protein